MGDEAKTKVKLIGANKVPVASSRFVTRDLNELSKRLRYLHDYTLYRPRRILEKISSGFTTGLCYSDK
jgi:hypothetical protein